MNGLNSPRAALVVIASVFILPLVLAWLMFNGVIEYRPTSTRNLGFLVEPPVPISWHGVEPVGMRDTATVDFTDNWLILYATPVPCDDPCMEAIVGMRQVHKAAGRHRARIRLALLVQTSDTRELQRLQAVYEPLQLIENPGRRLWRSLEQAAGRASRSTRTAGSTYLIDPLSNIMMYYPPESDPNDLRQDLRRLLTWSKQDSQP